MRGTAGWLGRRGGRRALKQRGRCASTFSQKRIVPSYEHVTSWWVRGSIRIDGTQCSCPSAITRARSSPFVSHRRESEYSRRRNAFQPPRSAALASASAAFRSQMKPPRSAARFHACGMARTSCHRLHTRCAAPRSPMPTPSSESTWYSRSVLSACSMCVGDDGAIGADGPEVGGSSSTSIANVGAGRAAVEAEERGGR